MRVRRAAPRFGALRRLFVALSSGFILASSAQAADSLTELFLEGRFGGQLRLFYIDRNFTGIDAHRYAFAIGGHLRYDTGIWHGVQLGAALYATGRMPLGQKRRRVDPSLFGKDLTSYILPAEAYARYRFDHATVKVGRQQLHTPLVCDDDVRMIPCHYEAVVVRSHALDSTELTAAHVFSIAPGTIANAYPNGGGAGGDRRLQLCWRTIQ